jgi:predicted dithiol-disulfide oxidoreductase (DUF899 family)
MKPHRIVDREEWLKARTALLAKEKELTKFKDSVTAQRQQLPWVKIEKSYVFDGPHGPVTLLDLFEGRSQLFVKHFMMPPGAKHQCVGCSLHVDHIVGLLSHLQNHDVSYAVVARAPIEEIEVVRKRMGWPFHWVSSYRSDFNRDFNVSFSDEEIAAHRAYYNFRWTDPGLQDLSGDSAFFKDEADQIFHTYSAYGRGSEQFLGIYGILDVMPKGRNETGPTHRLGDWARPHDMYGKGGEVEPNGRYHAA